jgi:hypothetical protein
MRPGRVVVLTYTDDQFADPRFERFFPPIKPIKTGWLLRPQFYRRRAWPEGDHTSRLAQGTPSPAADEMLPVGPADVLPGTQGLPQHQLDLERVGVSIDGLSPEEVECLRRAASRLNEFVAHGVPVSAERVHELHFLSSAKTLYKAFRPHREGNQEVYHLDPAYIPERFRGHYRDGLDHVVPIRFRDGVSRGTEVTFDIDPGARWLDVPEGGHVEQEMNDYFVWLGHALTSDRDGVDLAAEAYARFMKTHPYINVNDRTSWLIMNWVLLLRRYPPFYVTPEILDRYVAMSLMIMESPLSIGIPAYQDWFRLEYSKTHADPSTAPCNPRLRVSA